MSVTQAHGTNSDPAGRPAPHSGRELDRDLVAVLGMLAILVLTGLCFLGQGVLPL